MGSITPYTRRKTTDKKQVIIALDVGTCNCKISIDLLDSNDRASGPRCFRSGPYSVSFPTMISYSNKKFLHWGSAAAESWSTTPKAACCNDFMWHLSSYLSQQLADEHPTKLPEWQNADAGIMKPLESVIRDYLDRVYSWLQTQSKADGWGLDKYKWHFAFSVPGYFRNIDKASFNKIIQEWNRSKNHPYTVIRQPDAAAIYAVNCSRMCMAEVASCLQLENLMMPQPSSKAFILCDIGSNRAEVMSFFVESYEPVIKVKRTPVNIKFHLHGSNSIDRAFANYLRTEIRCSRKEFTSSEDERKTLRIFKERKENVKEEFEPFEVELFGLGGKHLRSNIHQEPPTLTIKKSQFEKWFNKAVENTVTNIRSHWEMARTQGINIESVVMTGGLSLSSYFCKRLEERLSDEIKIENNITVRAPPESELAVSLGTLLEFRQWPYAERRRSRASYGLIRPDKSIEWFFDKGQSYLSKRIRNVESHLRSQRTADCMKITIAYYCGDLGTRPSYETEGEKIEGFFKHTFELNAREIAKPNAKQFFLKRTLLRKKYVFSFTVSDSELSFDIRYNKDQVTCFGKWSDLNGRDGWKEYTHTRTIKRSTKVKRKLFKSSFSKDSGEARSCTEPAQNELRCLQPSVKHNKSAPESDDIPAQTITGIEPEFISHNPAGNSYDIEDIQCRIEKLEKVCTNIHEQINSEAHEWRRNSNHIISQINTHTKHISTLNDSMGNLSRALDTHYEVLEYIAYPTEDLRRSTSNSVHRADNLLVHVRSQQPRSLEPHG